jgi:hypothetical protein
MSDVPIYGNADFGAAPRSRGAVILPLMLGGIVGAVVLAMRSPFASWLRGFFSDIPGPADLTGTSLLDRGLAPAALRNKLVGRGKSTAAAACGAPRTAAGSAGKVVIGRNRRADFWQADTWYYPLDSQSQTAMAIRFERGIARNVEFFDAPRL